jgi:hypothetical protein
LDPQIIRLLNQIFEDGPIFQSDFASRGDEPAPGLFRAVELNLVRDEAGPSHFGAVYTLTSKGRAAIGQQNKWDMLKGRMSSFFRIQPYNCD